MPPRKKTTAAAAKKTAKPKPRATKKSKSKKEDNDSDYDPNEEETSLLLEQELVSTSRDDNEVYQSNNQIDEPNEPFETAQNADGGDNLNPVDDNKIDVPDNGTDSINTDSGDRVNRDRFRIFVTRLPFEATSADIENYFKQFGEVEDAYCPKQPGKPHLNKGFGFISFKNDEVLQSVFNARPHNILGREIVVDKATIRSEQSVDKKKIDSSRSKRSSDALDRDSNKINKRSNNRHYDSRSTQSAYNNGPPVGSHQGHGHGYGNMPPGYNQPASYNSYGTHGYDARSGYYNRSGPGYEPSSGGYSQAHGNYGGGSYSNYDNRQAGYDRNYNNPPPYERQYESGGYNRGFDPNKSVNYVFSAGEKERRGESYDRRYQYENDYSNRQHMAQQMPYSSNAQPYNNYETSTYDPSRPTPQGNDALEAMRLKNKLFVGRMRTDTTVATMRNYFERFGELIDAYIPKDPKTQKGKGFGFISFLNEASIRAVLQATYKHVLDGREVIVDMADADQKKNR